MQGSKQGVTKVFRGQRTTGRCSVVLTREITCHFLFSFLHQICSGKGSTLKRNNLPPKRAPLGNKSYPFRLDSCSEGRQKQF